MRLPVAGKSMLEEYRLAAKKPSNRKARSEEAGLIVERASSDGGLSRGFGCGVLS